MKSKRKIAFFLALISLFYSVSLIQKTYAKYITSATADADMTIAKWSIKVNEQDVLANNNFTSKIVPEYYGSDYVKDTVIAPTSSGYFDITIDGSETEVSYDYTINVTQATTNTVTDLKVIAYEIDSDGNILTYNDTSITGTVNYSDESKSHNVRFYVLWIENDSESMNNAADTEASINGNAAFKVDVNVIQKK